MDYLKYKTIKLHNDYKNRKKILNDTFNNAYTECSEKTAPTYTSEGLRSRSGKFHNNNFLEFKKNTLNTLSNCSSNRFNYVGEHKNHNKNCLNNKNEIENYSINKFTGNNDDNFNNTYNNLNNNYIQKYTSNHKGNDIGNINCLRKEKDNNYNNNDYKRNNNFEKTKRKIDDFIEEKNRIKNKRGNFSLYLK